MRVERDTLGDVEVPDDAYYGAQTARALVNFPISGRTAHPALIRAYARIKWAAARANAELGALDAERAGAIERAAAELADGTLAKWIVVDAFNSGAGTALHMNVNEVLAGRAAELLGAARSDRGRVHPNDHVNAGQSTNDTFPTAMRLAALELARPLDEALAGLQHALAERAAAFADVVKPGRTHLMDALPVTLGQELGAYAHTIAAARAELAAALPGLRQIGLGGSAVGTGVNTQPGYAQRAAELLAAASGEPLARAADLFAAMQSLAPFVRLSAALRGMSVELVRIAGDLRLMGSGPAAGFGELQLPAVQPGSSIMPGKVNPTMAEMLTMVCFQVIGYDHAIALAAGAGQLELNVTMPLVAADLCDGMSILTAAVRQFGDRCVAGLTANRERCRALAEASSALATVLAPALGYAATAEIVAEAQRSGEPIAAVANRRPDIPQELREQLEDLRKMTK